MSDDKLKEIFDSINSQMIVEQNVGYKNKYSPILTEEIDLYNAVIKYKEVINKAIKYINGAYEMATYAKSVSLEEENIEDLLDILKEVKDK